MKLKVIGALAAIGLVAALTAGTAFSALQSPIPDISGPCDEAEHRDDPECVGITVSRGEPTPGDSPSPSDTPTPTAGPRPSPSPNGSPSPSPSPSPGDISGPCDEAEHRNDPRCTGAGGTFDNSGPGNANDDDNSGPGSGDDRHDNSGPGSDD